MKETSLAFYCTARRLLSIPCCDLYYYYYYYRKKYNLSNFNLLRQYEIAIVLVCDCAFASNNLLRTLWIRTNKQNGQIKTSAHHTAHTCVVHPVMDNSADTWDEGESSGLVVNLVSQMGQAKWARSYTYLKMSSPFVFLALNYDVLWLWRKIPDDLWYTGIRN